MDSSISKVAWMRRKFIIMNSKGGIQTGYGSQTQSLASPSITNSFIPTTNENDLLEVIDVSSS